MSILIVVIHVFVCIALIMIVLLQTGKGADMGAAFGGGASQTLFGTTGASTFLSKATTAAAIIFMLTSLALAYMAGTRQESDLVTDAPPAQSQAAPAEQAPPATDAEQKAPAVQAQPAAPAAPQGEAAPPSEAPEKANP
ncbi:MAG: preprotein translocase subunit SecG [Desulfatitalea sp.]|nr:preprotein translocase subunit SecG [Desulfatitalea sp.]